MESHNRLSDIRQAGIPQLIVVLMVSLHGITLSSVIPQSIIATWDCLDEKPEGTIVKDYIESVK